MRVKRIEENSVWGKLLSRDEALFKMKKCMIQYLWGAGVRQYFFYKYISGLRQA